MKRLSLLPCLLILLSACSLPFGGTPTQEPLPPTPTPIGVALPPAWTPTPGVGASATARPTSAPAAEPTATPAIEVTALRLTELPSGYTPAQPVSYGLSPAILSAGVLRPSGIAMFSEPNSGTLVISVAALLATDGEEQGFARWIETPTTLIEVLAGVLGQLEGTASVLDGYADIGTASAAAQGRILLRNTRYDTEIVLLRQGPAAGYIAVLVPRGARSGFTLHDLAAQYAARLQATVTLDAPTPPLP